MKLLKTLTLVCLVVMPFVTGCTFRRSVYTETEKTQQTISTEPVVAPAPPAPAPAPAPQGMTETIEEKSTQKRVIERKIVP